MSILWAIIAFCILIISHELGHFAMAKAFGIYVYDFNLGMGPEIFSYKGKETKYVFRLLPIGGAVRMMGEDEGSDNPRAFNRKPVLKRMAVIFAGPFMNFITAILIFMVVFLMLGMPTQTSRVGMPIPGQAAEAAGIEEGDLVLSINGQGVEGWMQMTEIIQAQEPGAVLDVIIKRGDNTLPLTIKPYFDEESSRWLMGIQPFMEKRSVFSAIGLGVSQSYELSRLLLVTLAKMVTRQVPADLAGPIGVVNAVGEAASSGMQNFLILVGFLSINLGIINLLPLPALDGSRLVFLALEGIRGKPIDPEKEGRIHFIGFALLMLLMVMVTYKDILRLIQG